PVRLLSLIQGSFEPSHAERAPSAHGRGTSGSMTATGTWARSPEPDTCTSPTPLRRGSSVTRPCESAAAADTRPIARPLVVAVKSSSVVRLPYASRATTRSTTVSRDRTDTGPATAARPRSTTRSCGGPGSAYKVAVLLNVPTLAVITRGPARSGSVTRTRTVPVASVSPVGGVAAPLLGSAAVKRYVPGVVPARIRNVATPRWSVMATGSRVSPPGTALAPRNITSTFGCGTAPL